MMPELDFRVTGAEPMLYAAAPQLALKLCVTNRGGETIHGAMLRCQVQIEATRRHYEPHDQPGLLDIFGEAPQWSRTLRKLQWAQTQLMLPAFTAETTIDLPLPCSSDFNILAAKYFQALEGGTVPVCLLFSGAIFYRGAASALQVAQVSWEKEATFDLPVQTWKETVEHFFPNTAWLYLRRDLFARLAQFKSQHGIPTLDQALERLLETAEEKVAS